MKRMSEILEIMYEYCDRIKPSEIDGLCGLSFLPFIDGRITAEEKHSFTNYLYNNKPKNSRTLRGDNFFWEPEKIKPRKRYLKKHIKKNKKLEEKEEL